MANKLMFFPNDDTQNYSLCRLKLVLKRLDTQQNSIIFPKVVKSRKRYYKTLGTTEKNNLKSPLAP